ncbi:hypothetical protein KUTeg_012435 [Tegillarca granosa]|uniref:TIR domain-containing protein n=1 Tax=Tegillarca granosa TaxID=220873 RepID=A0ABQ9F324_TEGGR|nr:hypothetical protein KUTeg_012435 [Tegillarca granosa]
MILIHKIAVILLPYLFSVVICRYQDRCRLYQNDKSANCSSRGFTSIQQEPDFKTNEVRSLDLSNNRIARIQTRAFIQFRKLKSLNLDDNNISEIEANAFVGLEALTTLTIRNNMLIIEKISIPKYVFAPLKRLRNLYIGRNPKVEHFPNDLVVYPDRAFSYLHQLEFLSLDLYQNPEFGVGFKKMKSLKTIKFDKCDLLSLKNDTFKNLSSSVQNFYMTKCGDISPYVGIAAFEHFVNLKILDLSHSLISLPSAMNLLCGLQNNYMEEINFYKVNTNMLAASLNPYSVILTQQNTYYLRQICVKRLNLGFNEIVEVRKGSLFSLRKLKCLEEIVVSGNRFDLIYSLHLLDLIKFINKAINMRYFDFSFMSVEFPSYLYPYTPIKTDQKKVKRSLLSGELTLEFTCPPKWHTLRFSHNLWYLQYIRNMTFKGCRNFRVLDLSYSSMQQLNFFITGIEMTETLDISGIDISTVFPLLLYSVPNLKNLIITSVNLDKLFDKTMGFSLLSIVKYIEKIVMTKNHLRNIPSLVFKELDRLKHINLSENALEKFPETLLNIKSIRTLDLSDNKLTGLPQSAITWLENASRKNGHVKVFLKGNLLSCKCENSQFIKWLFTTKIKLDNKRNYSCVLEGGQISNTIFVNEHFSEIFVNCVSTFWLIFSVVFSAVMMIALILSVIAFRFRWRISYFFHRYLRQDYELIDISEYEFDAFVAYPADDFQWVWRELRIQMEENCGLKLCLHDREFVPGETISQNIHNFMQKSRKIIFDMTPGFTAARWFEYELETAKMDMVERRNNNGIIVIIRNGIQPEQMPRALSQIWESITCLTWPDENDTAIRTEAEEMFWNRLKDVLQS